MKFMKLGSKPDTFQTNDADSSRYVLSELTTDVTIIVDDVKFHLHKFPLLSKSAHLQSLILNPTTSPTPSTTIHLPNFPGGPTTFALCAKFCYGITVTLNPYNLVSARCGAQYLAMTEDVDRGNLIYKIDVFLNSTILRSCWKDAIIVLQTTKCIEGEVRRKIVSKCVDCIAGKIVVDPRKVKWGYTNTSNNSNRKVVDVELEVECGGGGVAKDDWWVEDVNELEIDLYKRVMVAVAVAATKRRVGVGVGDGSVVMFGEALRRYAVRWLPDTVEALVADEVVDKNRGLLEGIISLLLPDGGGCGCSCGFMLKLLKASILVDVDESLQQVLIEMISGRLDEASVRDLLLPVRKIKRCDGVMMRWDVEMVERIVERYVKAKWDDDGGGGGGGGDDKWLRVGKLVDGYLAEVGSDPNLEVTRFVRVAKLVPEIARPCHDGLYGAINVYLKEHPDLSKSDKKQLCCCGLLDVKRLTTEASIHAAGNELLPVRVVVQVLYFEQVRRRSSSSTGTLTTRSQTNNNNTTSSSLDLSNSTTPSGGVDDDDDEWENKPVMASSSCLRNSKSLRQQMEEEEEKKVVKVKVKSEEDDGDEVEIGLEKNTTKRMMVMGRKKKKNNSRSSRIFDKLWITGKNNNESKSCETTTTSGSSQSPTTTTTTTSTSLVVVPVDDGGGGGGGGGKSSTVTRSTSRHRRNSIS